VEHKVILGVAPEPEKPEIPEENPKTLKKLPRELIKSFSVVSIFDTSVQNDDDKPRARPVQRNATGILHL